MCVNTNHQICISHNWNDGKTYKSIGRSDDMKTWKYSKLPYIVVQCIDCKKNFIYDEAGQYYEFKGEVFPF